MVLQKVLDNYPWMVINIRSITFIFVLRMREWTDWDLLFSPSRHLDFDFN